jgi:hypothetical protein
LSAPIAGRNGRLYVDTSAAADGSAQPLTKSYVAGLKDAQGDFSGFWDADGTLTQYVADGVARKFYLYPQAGSAHVGTYWFGTATFDLTTTLTVGGAAESSGSWAAATSVGYVQA